jgi:hypothetical protein
MAKVTPVNTDEGYENWQERQLNDDQRWYLMFISIVFGVFISVWIEPIVQIFPPLEGGNPYLDMQNTIKLLFSMRTMTGAIMFIMLICLWWWYGIFLGSVAPARGFWAFLYDFISLCFFAVAFRMWSHPSLFPIIVSLASGLMLGRFFFAFKHTEAGSKRRKALTTALITLTLFLVGALSAGAMVAIIGVSEFLTKKWYIIQSGTLILLGFGIFATFVAVSMLEGYPFANKMDTNRRQTDPKAT